MFTQFDGKNDQNLKNSHNLPPDFGPVCFTLGAKRQFAGPSPKPMLGVVIDDSTMYSD